MTTMVKFVAFAVVVGAAAVVGAGVGSELCLWMTSGRVGG